MLLASRFWFAPANSFLFIWDTETALWAMWVHGPAFRRSSPQVSISETALWAMRVHGPAFRGSSLQSSHRRWPCGPRECMVPLSAGPPHSLHIEDGLVGHVGVWARFPRVLPTVFTSEMALWAT